MLFTLVYFTAFTLIAYIAFRGMFTTMRAINRAQNQPPRRSVPHPELLDSNGQPSTEPLLVVNFVESPEEVRRRLEEIYDKS